MIPSFLDVLHLKAMFWVPFYDLLVTFLVVFKTLEYQLDIFVLSFSVGCYYDLCWSGSIVFYLESASVFPLAASLQAANHSAYCCSWEHFCHHSLSYPLSLSALIQQLTILHFGVIQIISLILIIYPLTKDSLKIYNIQIFHQKHPLSCPKCPQFIIINHLSPSWT